MTPKQKLEEIIAILSFLQLYIKNNVKASFIDLTFSLETIVMNMLNVFEKGDGIFSNANAIKHNYPAIDLHNKRGDAIQVTTTADSAKLNETIKTYQKNKLTYKSLLILGFVSHTRSSASAAQVEGIDYLINKIKHASKKQMDEVYAILHENLPLNSLYPTSDKLAFEVVFRVIDRSALRDRTLTEGSFEDMVAGLKEIKEVITTGKIIGKSIRAKALVEYSAPIQDKLATIEFNISKIIQICNRAKNRNSRSVIILTTKEKADIDKLKAAIAGKVNDLAISLGSSSRIATS